MPKTVIFILCRLRVYGNQQKKGKSLRGLTLNDYRRLSWKWPTLGEAIATNQRIFMFMDTRLIGRSYYKYRWVYPSNYEISLSWTSMSLIESAGCSKVVDFIEKKCSESYYYDFMEVDLFLT